MNADTHVLRVIPSERLSIPCMHAACMYTIPSRKKGYPGAQALQQVASTSKSIYRILRHRVHVWEGGMAALWEVVHAWSAAVVL